MIVAGLVTVIQWQGLFPNLRDYLALKPLPLRLFQVFVASRVLEQGLPKPSGRSAIGEPAAALLGMLMRNSLGRAAFVFALQTLRRNRPHKLVIGFSA
jgi:hypothetical protein